MSLNDALKKANEKAQEKHLQIIRDRRIQYASDAYGYAAKYDNAVIVAGYAAFFALWAGTYDDIEPFARLLTVALMGTSLMLYIAWQMLQMFVRQKYEFEKADAFDFEDNPLKFNQVWDDIDRRFGIAQMRVIRFWPFTFVPSVVFGFGAAILLSYSALAAAFDWPQLTGHF